MIICPVHNRALELKFSNSSYPASLMDNDENNRELWSRRLKLTIFILMTILAVVLAYKLYQERTRIRPIIQIEKPVLANQRIPSTPEVDKKPQPENKKPDETKIFKCINNGRTVYSESPCNTSAN